MALSPGKLGAILRLLVDIPSTAAPPLRFPIFALCPVRGSVADYLDWLPQG